jgi:hypothetical protein
MMLHRTDNIEGTHLIGEVRTTRADLTALFGKPIEYGDEGDKVTIEWGIKWGETIATIYDWKRYEEGTPQMGELYNYHVGGLDYKALDLVNGLLDLGKRVL